MRCGAAARPSLVGQHGHLSERERAVAVLLMGVFAGFLVLELGG